MARILKKIFIINQWKGKNRWLHWADKMAFLRYEISIFGKDDFELRILDSQKDFFKHII